MDMVAYDLLIHNGTLLTGDGTSTQVSIAVKDEKIKGIYKRPTSVEARKVIDSEGLYIIPG